MYSAKCNSTMNPCRYRNCHSLWSNKKNSACFFDVCPPALRNKTHCPTKPGEFCFNATEAINWIMEEGREAEPGPGQGMGMASIATQNDLSTGVSQVSSGVERRQQRRS